MSRLLIVCAWLWNAARATWSSPRATMIWLGLCGIVLVQAVLWGPFELTEFGLRRTVFTWIWSGPTATPTKMVTFNVDQWIREVLKGILVVAVSLVVLGVFVRHYRRKQSRCLACGYDWRGLDRCPECGAA